MDPPSFPPPGSPIVAVVEYTVYLRVIGIFAILVASLVGSIPPLLMDLRTGRRWQAVRILKAGAAGAILALALIHVLGDSFTDFGSLPVDAGSDVVLGYPWAALCMLASIIFMVILEHILNVSHMQESGHSHSHRSTDADTDSNITPTKTPLLLQNSDDLESALCVHKQPPACTANNITSPDPCSHSHPDVIITHHNHHEHHDQQSPTQPSIHTNTHSHLSSSDVVVSPVGVHVYSTRTHGTPDGHSGHQQDTTTTQVMQLSSRSSKLQQHQHQHGHIHVDHHESAHGGHCTHHPRGEHHRSPTPVSASRQPAGGERSEYRSPSESSVNATHRSAELLLPPTQIHTQHAQHNASQQTCCDGPGVTRSPEPSSHRDCGACADHHDRHHTLHDSGSSNPAPDPCHASIPTGTDSTCLAHARNSSCEPCPSPDVFYSDVTHGGSGGGEYQARGTCGDGNAQHGHLCPDSQADRWLHSDAQHPTVNGAPHVAAHRAMVVAYLMEIGCVFHSIIIGIDLGLGMDSRTRTITRVTVLCFHQAMEGLGLGAVVGSAGFSRNKAFFMCCLYSLTTPIGVAIGLGISATYDAGGVSALAVNGAFNGVSAGLLLYVGLVTILVEEFTSKELLLRENNLTRWLMYAALCASAAGMSVIGIWA